MRTRPRYTGSIIFKLLVHAMFIAISGLCEQSVRTFPVAQQSNWKSNYSRYCTYVLPGAWSFQHVNHYVGRGAFLRKKQECWLPRSLPSQGAEEDVSATKTDPLSVADLLFGFHFALHKRWFYPVRVSKLPVVALIHLLQYIHNSTSLARLNPGMMTRSRCNLDMIDQQNGLLGK